MRLHGDCLQNPHRVHIARRSGFTLVEALVSFGIGMFIAAGAMAFIWFSAIAVSGLGSQSVVSQRAANTMELIESRVRFATSISNDVTGNILTLGFDDNPTNDSDGDGIAYNDRDHYERFQFLGVNSTNTTACASNMLVYYTNINSTASQTLIPAGVRNLPGYNIFSLTNKVILVIRFGVVDTYTGDHFQSDDIEGTAISMNLANNTNIITSIIQ